MFTGIIEELGHVVAIDNDGGNTHFKIKANMASELKIDQSLAHDGCCLTVVHVEGGQYVVTAIKKNCSGEMGSRYSRKFRAMHEKRWSF